MLIVSNGKNQDSRSK